MTGASGCIGHYIAEALIQNTEHDLFFLVRDPKKLKFDYESRPGVTILQGDMRQIERFGDLLKTMDVAILAATAWGGQECFDVNVIKNIQLLELLDPQVCQQAIYFSTASVLDRNNQPLKEAGQLGTDYIRSKYDCLGRLSKLKIAPKITSVFPTLVLGGDGNKPYSHISSGIGEVVKWFDIIRFLKADGSFHFIHAKDIAQVVQHLVDHPPDESNRKIVLGNKSMTVNEAVAEVGAYLGKKSYLRVPLTLWSANFLIAAFKIQMEAWDRFSINYRHFTYQNPVSPETLGLTTYCPTFTDILKISGIPRK